MPIDSISMCLNTLYKFYMDMRIQFEVTVSHEATRCRHWACACAVSAHRMTYMVIAVAVV